MVKTLLNYNKKRFWAGILLAQFVLFYIFSKIQFVVDIFEWFFESKKNFHTNLLKGIPFSIGDIIYVLIVVIIIIWIITLILKKKSTLSFKKILILLNVTFLVYQLLWGMMYFQKPIKENLPEKEVTTKELKRLTAIYLQKTIEARKHINTHQDGTFKISNLQKLKEEILKQQKKLPKNIIAKKPLNEYNLKNSIFNEWMNYSGILGYFNPFTGEAQYNKNLPETYIPFTLAHETAHQYGLAKEQEANFFAFLIGENTSNKDLHYATNYYVLKSLLNALHEEDEYYVDTILDSYSQGMKKDREKELLFRKEHQGIIESFFGTTNDLFLKSNRQEGSITYSYFIHLLVQYESTK